ncbi:FecCD family ABC transporter permease [Aeromicrobium sp. P5_D10]
MKTDARRTVLLSIAIVLLFAVVLASLAIGARSVPPIEVWRALTDPRPIDDHSVVRDIRVPRTILGLLVGAALGASGTLVQTLTRNPLAEPGLLGVTAGASFAITAGAAAGLAGGQLGQLGLSLLGAVAAAAAVYAVGRTSPLRLILAGVALSAVLSGVTLGLRLMDPQVFNRYRFWSVGSLAGREQLSLALPVAVVGIGLIGTLLVTRPLNALALGEQVGHTLGVNVVRTRIAVLVLVTLLAGAATAIAGPIAFVGLMVPHLSRRLAAGSVPWLMAFTIVIGPLLLVAADVGARMLLPTGEVPVAIVTAFIGAPVLIWAVRRYGAGQM